MKVSYTSPYTQAHLAAKEELEQRFAELESIQKRIDVLQGIVQSTEPFAVQESLPPFYGSMIDLCRTVLARNVGREMTVQDVLQVIALMGITLKYSNPTGIVHTTLTRLAKKIDSGVVAVARGVIFDGSVPRQDGPMKFTWNPNVPAPPPSIPFLKEM